MAVIPLVCSVAGIVGLAAILGIAFLIPARGTRLDLRRMRPDAERVPVPDAGDGRRNPFRQMVARISFAARTPVVTPPSMKPWKSGEVCSPAKWMFPSASPSIPPKVVY